MKISYNWLKEYINTDLPVEEAGAILTDIGLEVEEIKAYNGPGNGLKGLVVGHVKHVEQHPDADRLRVTKVDIGTGEDLQIVCGAPNVAEGQKVVVATVGATLYPVKGEPFKISKSKIRGIESMGMLCAQDEIGIGESHEGIIVLREEATIGSLVKDIYGAEEDFVLEIGLTPNRADAMGHIGVARDLRAAIATRTGEEVELSLPYIDLKEWRNHIKLEGKVSKVSDRSIKVTVENTQACKRYSGILLEGVTIKESPEWMQNRLKAIGMRPINNVVDVTNYILAEYGQPLHAFDADKIKGNQIIVKNLPTGTEFKALDGTDRKLDERDLMICDAEEGMCIAGVFGGLDSGVSDATTNIFIECACFDAITVRKTAGRHNLRTDSAQKFEKGTDPNHTVHVLLRALELLLQVAGGTAASDVVDIYPNPVADFEVEVSYSRLNTLIGLEIDKETVKTILHNLEIKIASEDGDTLQLLVPPFKVDVKREADIVEEVLRIYGLNNIPFPDQLRSSLAFSNKPDKEKINATIATILMGNGFNEIFTNSLSNSQYAKDDEAVVKLLNSLNVGLDSMRTTMLYSGLEAISHNLNRRNSDLRFFEIGKTYHLSSNTFKSPKGDLDNGASSTALKSPLGDLGVRTKGNQFTLSGYEEKEHLAIYLTGNSQGESWRVKDRKASDFYLLKAYVENVLEKLGVDYNDTTESENTQLEFGLSYKRGERVIATFGKVNKSELKTFDIKQEVFYADFDWTYLVKEAGKTKPQYKAVSKFPTIRRDLALLLDRAVEYNEVEKIAWKEGKRILKSVHLFDKYEDAKLGENKKSYAVSYVFEDDTKTLTDTDIDKIMEKLINRYREVLNAEIRQ